MEPITEARPTQSTSSPDTLKQSLEVGQLTIVIPNYNHRHFLPDAIESVLSQSKRPDRLLIIDDCSTDDSWSLISSYGEDYEFVSAVRLDENHGVVSVLNQSLGMLNTEYVCFLAADDYYAEDFCKRSMEILDRYPDAPLCNTLIDRVDKNGNSLFQADPAPLGSGDRYLDPETVLSTLMRYGSFLNGNSCVYRVKALREIGGFDPELSAFCDGFAMERLALANGACYVPQRLAINRRFPENFSSQIGSDLDASMTMFDALQDRLVDLADQSFPDQYKRELGKRTFLNALRMNLNGGTPDPDGVLQAITTRWASSLDHSFHFKAP